MERLIDDHMLCQMVPSQRQQQGADLLDSEQAIQAAIDSLLLMTLA